MEHAAGQRRPVVTRGELQDWVAAARNRLAGRGVSLLFGFAPSIRGDGGASWASFMSRRGTGRLVLAPDGSARIDVYAFADGACLREDREDHSSVDQLEQIADVLTPPGGDRATDGFHRR